MSSGARWTFCCPRDVAPPGQGPRLRASVLGSVFATSGRSPPCSRAAAPGLQPGSCVMGQALLVGCGLWLSFGCTRWVVGPIAETGPSRGSTPRAACAHTAALCPGCPLPWGPCSTACFTFGDLILLPGSGFPRRALQPIHTCFVSCGPHCPQPCPGQGWHVCCFCWAPAPGGL